MPDKRKFNFRHTTDLFAETTLAEKIKRKVFTQNIIRLPHDPLKSVVVFLCRNFPVVLPNRFHVQLFNRRKTEEKEQRAGR